MKRLATSLVLVFWLAVAGIGPQTALGDTQWPAAKAVIDLDNGVALTGISGAAGEWKHYRINVTAGSSNLVIKISGGSGDADLYTRFGSQPTSSIYDCRPYKGGNDEQCTVASPGSGYYYISLHAYAAYAGTTLEASYVQGGHSGEQELINGQGRVVSGSTGEWKHFFVNVPAAASNLVMQISGGSGDADLYTRFGARPTGSVYDCRPYIGGNNEQCTVASLSAGKYYVSLHGYAAYSNATLKATYQQGGTGDKTFIVTAVQDNLNNNDMYIMADGLSGLGYTRALVDTNIYTSEILDYLGRNITTLYHTGHGGTGSVMTYNGSISANDVTLNVENTFIATCLTLADRSWKNAFGANAKTLMGYTKVSYDYTDDTVAQNMIAALGQNKTYQMAWYLANAGIASLRDRWAEYVREGTGIVEYSARTGDIPSLSAVDWAAVESSGRVKAAAGLLDSYRTFSDVFRLSGSFEPAAVTTFAQDAGFDDLLGPVSASQQQAVEMARQWLDANGGFAADAVLDRVVPIHKRADAGDRPQIVGYSVHYKRDLNGLAVSGNRVADHITVLVGQNSVVAASTYWPQMQTGVSDQWRGKLLSVGNAIQLAAGEIARAVKGTQEIYLLQAEPVYGTRGPNSPERGLVPAYRVLSTAGDVFVINALTGEILL